MRLLKTKKEIGESSVVSIGELKDYKRIATKSPTIGYVFGGGGQQIQLLNCMDPNLQEKLLSLKTF